MKAKSEEQMCNYLMIWVGEKGRDIYNTWTLTDEEIKLLATYYSKFEDYVKPKSNIVFAHYIPDTLYPMQTIEEVVAEMPGATVFSVLYATSGYWQVKLDEASSKLCTFNSPFGRYRFTRLPCGIKSAPEVFQQQMSEIFEDIKGVKVIVDDILVWGRDVPELDARMKQVLDRAREVNLKLNRKKCQVRKAEVHYVGHLPTKDGLKPDPQKIRAVEAMEQPRNTKELRTFLGFIQYIGKFMPNLSQVTAPLRKLLDTDISWHWEREQQQSSQKLKAMATSAPVLGYYDPQK